MYLDMKHSYFKTSGVSVSHMFYSDMHIARTLPDTRLAIKWLKFEKTHAHNPICLINLSEPIECSDVRYYFLNLLFTYKYVARNFIYYFLLPPKKNSYPCCTLS